MKRADHNFVRAEVRQIVSKIASSPDLPQNVLEDCVRAAKCMERGQKRWQELAPLRRLHSHIDELRSSPALPKDLQDKYQEIYDELRLGIERLC